MSGNGYKLQGLDGVLAQLQGIGAELAVKALTQAMRVVFKPVLETAKSLVPVLSGELRDSITIGTFSPSAGETVAVVGLTIKAGKGTKQARIAAAAFGESQSQELPAARRWHWIELGTIHMPPHPYLRPALDTNAQGLIDGLKDAVAQKIQAAIAKGSK